MGRSPRNLPGDGRGDLVASHVGQFLIHELRGIGAAFAHKAGIEPLLGDAFELAEEVELRLLAGVAPFRVKQPLGDVEDERGGAHVAQCSRLMSTPSPMMPEFRVMDGPTMSG